MVYECAKILAEVSGLPRNKTYQRITPRTEEELRAVKDLSGGYLGFHPKYHYLQL
jgi:hypothetical protein